MTPTPLPAGEWTEVIGTAPTNYIDFQNTGTTEIRVFMGSAMPTQETRGFFFPIKQGEKFRDDLDKLYARPVSTLAGEITTRSG